LAKSVPELSAVSPRTRERFWPDIGFWAYGRGLTSCRSTRSVAVAIGRAIFDGRDNQRGWQHQAR
jgi:hypothetical protein